MRTEALVLDFDDTVIRMTSERWKIFEETLRAHGADETSLLAMNDIRGGGFGALVATALPNVDVAMFIDAYSAMLSADRIELCPGVTTILDWAAKSAVRAVILSSSSRALIHRELELAGIRSSVAAIFGYEDVPAVKPSPAAIRAVLDSSFLNDLRPESVAMVGDSLSDAATVNGQCRFAAVLSGATSRSAFREAGLPEEDIFDSLDDLAVTLAAQGDGDGDE